MDHNIHQFDNGIKVYDDHLIDAQRERYRHINIHEPEEEEIFKQLLKEIAPDGCFLNIGAAIGYYVILAKQLAPELEIHAVEPLKRHRDFLLENLELNNLDKAHFVMHSEGVSTSQGNTELIDHGYGSSLCSGDVGKLRGAGKSSLKKQFKDFFKKFRSGRQDVTHIVATKTLEDLILDIGRSVDLCQMDIQGLELDVLISSESILLTGKIRNFLIGTHSQEIHNGCMHILKTCGYSITYDNYETADQPDGILVARRD